MKSVSTILICMLIILSPSWAVEYLVPETASPPTIDGEFSSGEWDDAFHLYMVYPDITQSPYNGAIPPGFSPPDNAADLSADCYLKWDSEHLYIAFRVYDANVCWIDEKPIVSIDGDAAQFGFNPNDTPGAHVNGGGATIYDFIVDTAEGDGPTWHDRGGLGGVVQLDGSTLADGYIVEAALSWQQLGITPHYGQKHGAGFILIDTDNCASWDVLMADFSNNGTWANFHADVSNTMILISEDGCGTGELSQTDLNHDCRTNIKDFAIFASMWLDCTDPADPICW